jgi:hypothetical protein
MEGLTSGLGLLSFALSSASDLFISFTISSVSAHIFAYSSGLGVKRLGEYCSDGVFGDQGALPGTGTRGVGVGVRETEVGDVGFGFILSIVFVNR